MCKLKITYSPRCVIFFIILALYLLAGMYALAASALPGEAYAEKIELGKWTVSNLDGLMTQGSDISGIGERIDFISGKFLDTPYVGHTLIGDIHTPEVFTIDLEGMDCFTYIDYVEALGLSGSFPEFKDNLKKIRYKNGNVAFQNRNHFFSDWPVYNKDIIRDVTEELGGSKTEVAIKRLNQKAVGGYYLPGIPVIERTIRYIPASEVDEDVMSRMQTGDYVGIYTDIAGLDVSHTGIIIKKDNGVYLRHASSKKTNGKVVDEDLSVYIQNVPGLVIYRPLK